MKSRSQLSAAEVVALREGLAQRVDAFGIQTQPEVALRILDLGRDPDAQLKDYAEVVKTDPGLSGRLLKLANSALFAQRKPVTAVDRACLLLGLERLRAISLGFHLSRAVAGDKSAAMARKLWGESLFRACLGAELARAYVPSHASEAFVIGLMMDSCVPLMSRLVGNKYAVLYEGAGTPGRVYRRELDELPFTHVDLVSAIASRWKLPDVLAKPIELHHTPPVQGERVEPVHRLHRVAYTIGLIDLRQCTIDAAAAANAALPGAATAQRLLNIDAGELPRTVSRAAAEFQATTDMFREIADPLAVDDALMERVQSSIIEALDNAVEQSLVTPASAGVKRFTLGGRPIEIEVGSDGLVAAFLTDDKGRRVVSHRFKPGRETAAGIAAALGLEDGVAGELPTIDEHLRKLAA